MAKRILAALLILVLAISVACSGAKPQLNLEEAAETISTKITFTDSLLPIPENQLSNYYPQLAGVSDEYEVYMSSTGLTTEEFAVARAGEGSKADDVRAQFEKRIEDQRFRYESYLPEQVKKLDDAVIESKGDYVVMVICDDPDKAAEVAKDLLK